MKLIETMKASPSIKLSLIICAIFFAFSGCKKELPEAGSIEDLTPPEANFTYGQLNPDNYLVISFSNLSVSSTDYLWDFGDGNTSTEAEPVHTYSGDGVYVVRLTASDKLNVTDIKEIEVEITEPLAFIPPILEAGFEIGQLEDGTGDGNDAWSNSGLGGNLSISTGPVNSGDQAAKLGGDPSDARIGYQLLTVTPNTVYDVSFYYTMLNDQPDGFLTVSILNGPVFTQQQAQAATIGTVTVNDQTDPETYVQGTVSFDSGFNSEVAIYFFNEGSVETRVDDFSIAIGTGTVPPLANFTYSSSEEDYFEVSFTNNSVNADSFSWDFGDGNTSDEENPTHTYSTEGSYSVELIALNTTTNLSSSTTYVVDVSEPSDVVITNPGFDDFEVNNDNREAWRNSSLESDADDFFAFNGSWVLQMSSTARTGNWAGKLPTAENSDNPQRWLYQQISVDPNTDYSITGWIRNKDSGVGSTVTFTIYDAPFNNASTIGNAAAILQSVDFNEASGHDVNEWTEASIVFNSGNSSEIVLFITNDYTLNGDSDTQESESFLDDFSIEAL